MKRVTQTCRYAVPALVAAAILVSLFGRDAAPVSAAAKERERFLADVRAGVLAAVPEASHLAPQTSARDRARAASLFMASRAGVAILPDVERRLAAHEAAFLSGVPGRTEEEIAQLAASWIVDDVVPTLSPNEIERAIETARGFDAPDLPESFKRGRSFVKLSFVDGEITPAQARSVVEELRSSEGARASIADAVATTIAPRVAECVANLRHAAPERFPENDIGPVDALLVVYAVASGDLLAGSPARLDERMLAVERGIESSLGVDYSSPVGRRPYGMNGYLVSSPAPLLLARAAALVERLGAEERER